MNFDSDAWKAVMTIIADPSRVLTVVSVSTGLEWKINARRDFWCCLENGNTNIIESDNCSHARHLVPLVMRRNVRLQ